VFLVLSPQAKNPGMRAALRQQRTTCHWVQGRVFGSFAAGEKSITSHNENFYTMLPASLIGWLSARTR
jgi:hypothetical protein